MALTTTATSNTKEYIFAVSDGTPENTFEYRWSSTPPEGQAVQDYLQSCKREAELLAQHEIDKKTEPTPVVL